ncbi:Gamma-tubulin complex component 6 [Pseudocercospora fuligena]|uniref:Spindle pole body component n=1 Tax=Pseudocercospora fuligena TaxID=685502 RepID=A0A8H6RTI6_9PEZI|nr:Gamma-tubulin complex component 6 [Pseudocercospora fuligena]
MDNDAVSRGLPFEVETLWQKPSFFSTFDKDESILDAWDNKIQSLEFGKDHELPDLSVELAIPDLQGDDEDLSPNAGRVESQVENGILSPPSDDGVLEEHDIWDIDLDLERTGESGRLHTWEAFEGKDVPNSQTTAYLSEAGPGAFDAAIASVEKSVGVLPQDYTLRCLSALALGRSSSLFTWNESEQTFQQTLQGATISGTSLRSSESLTASLLTIGNQIKRLRIFSDAARSVRQSCPAIFALKSCVGDLLDAIDESVSAKVSTLRSMLQLQGLVTRPAQLLAIVTMLVESTKHCRSDESVISRLADSIHEGAQRDHAFAKVLQILLARVSVPWLETLAGNLGFADHAGVSDDDGAAEDFKSSIQSSTAYIGAEDRTLLSETTAAVSLLRQIDSNHTLTGVRNAQLVSLSPTVCFTERALEPSCIAETARSYQEDMISFLVKGTPSVEPTTADISAPTVEDTLWQDSDTHDLYLTDLDTIMSQLPTSHVENIGHSLHQAAVTALNYHEKDIDVTPDLSNRALDLSPIAHLRPLIATQNKLVNGVLLRQLLREHRLKHHLAIQRSFQMFGNGNFISRMCAALFSEDVQSAERRRGTVPTAETVGLRLGASHDERWPPASSELQLSLMGILNDSAGDASISENLSFAIRELPEAEIDRVLDPHSIYALDFLRLQYNVTAPLDAVLTSSALNNYDEIFRFLLKLLRLVHATGELSKQMLKARPSSIGSNFAQEAQLFVSVLVSHIMDLGIAPPWQELMRSIINLERKLDEEDARSEIGTRAHLGIEGLRQMHEACLDRIRSRLFLKRKHQKLRNAIETVFAALLKAAHAVTAEDFGALTYAFHTSVKAFVDLLKQTADKPPKSLAAAEAEDADVLRTLLLRLNWNEHYEDEDQTW